MQFYLHVFITKSTYFINHNSFALVKSIPIPHMSNIQYKFTVLCFMNSVTAKYKNSSETLSCIKSYAGMSLCVVHIVHPNKFVKLRKFHRFFNMYLPGKIKQQIHCLCSNHIHSKSNNAHHHLQMSIHIEIVFYSDNCLANG